MHRQPRFTGNFRFFSLFVLVMLILLIMLIVLIVWTVLTWWIMCPCWRPEATSIFWLFLYFCLCVLTEGDLVYAEISAHNNNVRLGCCLSCDSAWTTALIRVVRALERVVDFIFEYLFNISKQSITSVFVYACMFQRRLTIYAKSADVVTRRG